MSVAAALSSFGSLNGSFFSGGRVCYVTAREGHMVRKKSLIIIKESYKHITNIERN